MAKIIIVVTESAVSGNFNQMLLDIHLKGRLDRIVLDEVHKSRTDVNFRPKLEDLQKLALPVQYISLTATFPPPMTDDFNQFMMFKNPMIIRELNIKPKTRYQVRRISNQNIKKETKQLVDVKGIKI